MLTLFTSGQHNTVSPSQLIRQEEEVKKYPNKKGKSKIISVCRWHDFIYVKFSTNHKNVRIKIEWNKVTGYKVS